MGKKLMMSGLLLALAMVNFAANAQEQYLQQRNKQQIEQERAFQESYARRFNSDGSNKALMDVVNGKSGNVNANGDLVFSGPSEEETEQLRNMRWKQW